MFKAVFSRKIPTWLRIEHLLIAGLLCWYMAAVPRWYFRLGRDILQADNAGLTWVLLPVAILFANEVVRALLLQLLPGETAATNNPGMPPGFVRRSLTLLGDWLPFALFISIYLMFRARLTMVENSDLQDALLARWEERLLGGHASLWLESWVSVPLTVVMQAFYYAHIFFTTPAAAVFCYLKDRDLFRILMLALAFSALAAAFGYTLLPASGPYVFLYSKYSTLLPRTLLGSAMLVTVERYRVPNDIFPSLHVALSLICLLASWKTWRWVFWLFLPFVIGNWLACIYLRFHYVIDCIAGLMLGGLAYWGSTMLVMWEKRLKTIASHPLD